MTMTTSAARRNATVSMTAHDSEPTRAVTIYDVARCAYVSHQTVSRVLNGGSGVAPDTLKRVTAVIEKLGFIPNPSARSLRKHIQTDCWGVVLDGDQPRQLQAISALAIRARSARACLLVEPTDDTLAIEAAVDRLRECRATQVWIVQDGTTRPA